MRPTVLFVDDQPEMLRASCLFVGNDYEVSTAGTGEEALRLMADRPFAVVVADLGMPGMDGVQFLAAVRERHPDTVRLLLTGYADPAQAIRAVNDGHVFHFLTKPCSPAALRDAVATAAARHRAIVGERERAARALRASEDRYRQLFDAHPHPMWVRDRETGRFLAVNDAAVRRYGYSRDEFTAMTVHAIDPDAPPAGRAYPLTGTGQPVRHRLASGEVRQVEVSGNPIEFGDRPAYLVMAVDVTGRKLLEDQLRQAQKLEAIGQLAAGIAHEINTPVQYIGDNTTFLADAFKDLSAAVTRCRAGEPADPASAGDLDYLLDEIPRAIDQTLEGVTHVARIVKAMKEFAHPGTGEKVPVDLNHAVETVITVARSEWKYAAEVVTDLDPDLPPVPGLPGDLNQVLLNLLVNAAHAIQAAGGAKKGTVTISTRRVGGAAEVRVADTGCGIPEAIRGRVFEPFFTTKPVGQGTGQGLAIAHTAVVQRHGGSISFESAVGRGTTFVVCLPLSGDRVTISTQIKSAATRRLLPAGQPHETPGSRG
jgi:PAS domain S-box-containing protein